MLTFRLPYFIFRERMYNDLPEIGNININNYNKNNNELLTLKEYKVHAKRIVKKFGPKYGVGITKEILRNQDAFNTIVYKAMMADWRWDESREKHSSRTSYRVQCVKWAIQDYITKRNSNKVSMHSINAKNEYGFDFSDMLESFSDNPAIEVENKDEQEYLLSKINNIINSGRLKEQESSFIKLYYLEGKTGPEIASIHNLSRERVGQVIKKGLEKIREAVA